MSKLNTLLCCFATALIISCEKTPGKVVSTSPTEFSIEDQLQIGDAYQQAIEIGVPGMELLDRAQYPDAYNYVETMFQLALNTSPVERRRDFQWTVSILQDDANQSAFCLPGGHFYIQTGLLKFLETESQLLAVMAHEIYYADTDLMVKAMGSNFGGTTMGDILLGNPIDLSANAAAMPSLAFAGEKVLQADSFAVNLLCPFHYEPLGILHIVEKSEAENFQPDWLANRQLDPAYRIQKLEKQALTCGLPGVENKAAYQAFKMEELP